MGCYETIKDILFCPFCGKQQEEYDFQSTDIGDNMMFPWTIKEVKQLFPKSSKLEIYSQCRYCKEYISINLDLKWMKK